MNTIKTTLLLSGLTALLLLFGKALGGQGGMMMALIIATVMNFGAYWFSDKIVLKMYRAQEIDSNHFSGLYQLVEDLAIRANLPMPKVYIVNDDTPNAFATGRNPSNAAVAATTGIITLLNKEELQGVMAHELSHVNNRDTLISSIAATIGGAISMLANMAQFALIFGRGGSNDSENSGSTAGTFLMMLIAPIAATLIQMAVSRSREYGADAGAAQITQNPLALASALEKLENYNHYRVMPTAEQNPSTAHMFIINPLKGDSLRSMFSTHPATEERIRRLREM